MRVTATEAKNRFGSLSAEHDQALQAGQSRAGLAMRKKAFEAEFAEWTAAQNALAEAHGIPGADLHPWW